MNTGYTIKQTAEGYQVEFFRMNSSTLEIAIIETRGPFTTKQEAEREETQMREERE